MDKPRNLWIEDYIKDAMEEVHGETNEGKFEFLLREIAEVVYYATHKELIDAFTERKQKIIDELNNNRFNEIKVVPQYPQIEVVAYTQHFPNVLDDTIRTIFKRNNFRIDEYSCNKSGDFDYKIEIEANYEGEKKDELPERS